jgi:predicted GNAT family acetyltransferase
VIPSPCRHPEFPDVSSESDPEGSGSPLPLRVDDKYHIDEVVPLKHGNRTIILCFDGTGDQFDEDGSHFHSKGIPPAYLSQYFKISNIIQFSSMLRKDNKSKQMLYYQVRQLIWVVHHTGDRDSFRGQGFKDAGYDARLSFGCTYFG